MMIKKLKLCAKYAILLPFEQFRVQSYAKYLNYVLVFNIFFVLLHQK